MIHGTLHERHELKKELRMMLFAQKGGRSPLVESKTMSRVTVLNERYIAELAAEVLLEALKKEDLLVVKNMMKLYKSLGQAADEAGIVSLRNVFKVAAKEMNEYTAESGGPLSFLKKGISSLAQKIGGDSASSNPIVKGQTLIGVLTAGFGQLNDIFESNIEDYDPDSDDSPLEQAGEETETIETMKKLISKSFEPDGFYAKLKSFFGSTGIPYMKRESRDKLVEEILEASASSLTAIVEMVSDFDDSTPDVEKSLRRTAGETEDAPAGGTGGGKGGGKGGGSGGSGGSGGRAIPIKGPDDMARVIAGGEAENKGGDPSKAADAAEKNPKKVNARFLKYVADKSKQDPELVSNVIMALVKAKRIKADHTVVESRGRHMDVLSLSDVRRAHQLLIESGGSSRRWVHLLLTEAKSINDVSTEEIFAAAKELKLNDEGFASALKTANQGKGPLAQKLELNKGATSPLNIDNTKKKYGKYLKTGGSTPSSEPANDNQVVAAFDAVKKSVDDLTDASKESDAPPAPADMKEYAQAIVTSYNNLLEIAKEAEVEGVDVYEKAISDIVKLIKDEKFKIADLSKLAGMFDKLKDKISKIKGIGQQAGDKLKDTKKELQAAQGQLDSLKKTVGKLKGDVEAAKEAAKKVAEELEKSKKEKEAFKEAMAKAFGIGVDEIKEDELEKFIAAFIAKHRDEAETAMMEILQIDSIERAKELEDKTKEARELAIQLKDNKEKLQEFVETLARQTGQDVATVAQQIKDKGGLENFLASYMSKKAEETAEAAKKAGVEIDALKGELDKTQKSAEESKQQAAALQQELEANKGKMEKFHAALAKQSGMKLEDLKAAIERDGEEKVLAAMLSKKPEAVEDAAQKVGIDVPPPQKEETSKEDKKKQVADEVSKQMKDVTADQISAILDALPEYLVVESQRRRRTLLESRRAAYASLTTSRGAMSRHLAI